MKSILQLYACLLGGVSLLALSSVASGQPLHQVASPEPGAAFFCVMGGLFLAGIWFRRRGELP